MNFLARFWPFNQKTQPTKGIEMNNAEIWNTLTGPNSQALWNVFAVLATALGHPEGAKTIQLLGAAAPVIGQALPPHPGA